MNANLKSILLSLAKYFVAALQGQKAEINQQQNMQQNTNPTTWRYGDHTYTMKGDLTCDSYNRDATGTVTFTHIPANYQEFEALYNEFLGKTPHGTAAMMTMAMEMYGRDREEGLRCIQLINWPSNVNSVVSILKDKYGTSQYAPTNDSYSQRYLPAAVLKGARPENAYTPDRPYTIEMKASVNQHQQMQFMGSGCVMYIYVMGGGWDTHQRSVEIIKQPGNQLHQVFNCPSLYTQCKTIHGQWPGLQ